MVTTRRMYRKQQKSIDNRKYLPTWSQLLKNDQT